MDSTEQLDLIEQLLEEEYGLTFEKLANLLQKGGLNDDDNPGNGKAKGRIKRYGERNTNHNRR